MTEKRILNKRIARHALLLGVTAVLVACVTINVYFPEAAAERAADRFIQDVIGPEEGPTKSRARRCGNRGSIRSPRWPGS